MTTLWRWWMPAPNDFEVRDAKRLEADFVIREARAELLARYTFRALGLSK